MSQVDTDIKQMQAQIAKYGSVTQFGVRVQSIQGPGASTGNTGYFDSKTGGHANSGNKVYDAKWELGNWGNTMKFTLRK